MEKTVFFCTVLFFLFYMSSLHPMGKNKHQQNQKPSIIEKAIKDGEQFFTATQNSYRKAFNYSPDADSSESNSSDSSYKSFPSSASTISLTFNTPLNFYAITPDLTPPLENRSPDYDTPNNTQDQLSLCNICQLLTVKNFKKSIKKLYLNKKCKNSIKTQKTL